MSPWQVPPGAMRRTLEEASVRPGGKCAATNHAVGDDPPHRRPIGAIAAFQ